MRKLALFMVVALGVLVGCSGGYSFTGGNVGEAKTLNIGFFENRAQLVNPSFSQTFTESLKDFFLQQSSLTLVDGDADMEVRGHITTYSLKPQAARSGSEIAEMRFTVGIQVEFENHLEPENNYSQRFTRYRDFPSDQNFSDIEASLSDEIVRELCEDVLNRAIANW